MILNCMLDHTTIDELLGMRSVYSTNEEDSRWTIIPICWLCGSTQIFMADPSHESDGSS